MNTRTASMKSGECSSNDKQKISKSESITNTLSTPDLSEYSVVRSVKYKSIFVLVVYFLFTLLLTSCSASNTQRASSAHSPIVSKKILDQKLQNALKQQAAPNGALNNPIQADALKTMVSKKGTLRPGMKISLESVEDENLKGEFQVPLEGEILLPYGVKVQAAGLKFSEFKQRVKSAYAPFFQFEPSLRISLIDAKQFVEVQGLVKKPGTVLVKSNATLDEIISAGGGLSSTSELGGTAKYVRVLPKNGESFAIGLRDYYAGVSPVKFAWNGGDAVFFQSEKPLNLLSENTIGRKSVQFLGQIRNPGAYPYKSDESFYHYFVEAGGPTENSDFENIEVVRLLNGKKDSTVYNITKDNVNPDIRGGDIVIVHAQKDNSTITNASNILSAIAAALLAAIAI